MAKEIIPVLIRVRYHDDTDGKVDDTLLEALISTGEIKEFLRSSGWVKIGVDPVRGQRVERRRKGSIVNIYV
jgi:hypothetical protein